MSDSRPPRLEQRPRRSGLGLLLPLLLAGMLLFWIMTSNPDKIDTAMRGETLQIFPFDTPQGPGIARCVMDIPYNHTEVYIFPNGPGGPIDQLNPGELPPDPNKQLLEMSRTDEPAAADGAKAPPRTWMQIPQLVASGAPLGCTLVNDRDFVIFYASTVAPESGLITRAVGYVYPHLANNHSSERLFVDPDVLPEVFVAPPAQLLEQAIPDTGTGAEPPTAPAAGNPMEKPNSPDNTTSPAAPTPVETPPPEKPAGEQPVNLPAVENATASPRRPPTADGGTTGGSAALSGPVIWGFGRSASNAHDRRDRLCAIEIQGTSARLRSISTGPVQITANAFLLTAVPLDDVVHLFWRVLPENSLPSLVINHAVYDGHNFTLLPAIQNAPTGCFTTTRVDNQILLTVLKPVEPAEPAMAEHFRGKYELHYALLDGTPVKAPGAPTPPVLNWIPVRGPGTLENQFDLTAVTRLDGRVTQLMLRGAPHGMDDEITLVTIPPKLTGVWPSRLFIENAPQVIPDADKIVVFLMIGMLGLFGGVLLVAWVRPWRWLGRTPTR